MILPTIFRIKPKSIIESKHIDKPNNSVETDFCLAKHVMDFVFKRSVNSKAIKKHYSHIE